MLKFELVLPCYNEARSLEFLLKRAVGAAQEFGFSAGEFRLVMVENGSSDDSARVLENLSQGPLAEWLGVVKVPVNQGYGFGLLSGLRATSAPVVAYSHADQQCDPRDAFAAYRIVGDQEKVLVKGTRSGRNWKDRLVTSVFEMIAHIFLGLGSSEINAQPKVFPRSLLNTLTKAPKDFAFDLYLLYQAERAGFAIRTIAVKFPPRIHGVSKWAATFLGRYKTILKMIRYIFRLAQEEGRL